MSKVFFSEHFDPALRLLVEVQQGCEKKSVDKNVKEGIDKAIELMKARETYCETLSSQPSVELRQIRHSTLTHPFTEAYKSGKISWDMDPQMMIGELEGTFLQSFISVSKATRVLEIGMFTGYSALTFAEALPENGKVVTLEIEPYLETLVRGFLNRSPHEKKVDIRIGPAKDSLEKLVEEKQQFDVVFIDANTDGDIAYYTTVMTSGLLAPGGSVVFKNALFFGEPYMDRVKTPEDTGTGQRITSLNEFLRAQTDIHMVLLPVRDGIIIVRRKSDTLGMN